MLTAAQMMISSRGGRISRMALRETIFLRGLRRRPFGGSPAGQDRISPSGVERNVSTT